MTTSHERRSGARKPGVGAADFSQGPAARRPNPAPRQPSGRVGGATPKIAPPPSRRVDLEGRFAVRRFRSNRGDPSATDWSDWGRVEQEAAGEPPAGYESPGRASARSERDGEELGAALVEEETAVGPDSGAMQWIQGFLQARIGVASLRARKQKLAAEKIVAPSLEGSRSIPPAKRPFSVGSGV